MVCEGPDLPENNPHELNAPPRHDLPLNGQLNEDSDDEYDYFGYEPLPQAPEVIHSDPDNEENTEISNHELAICLPPIETVESEVTRDLWNSPINTDSIQMDRERAEQVMSAMANFSLPQTQIPEWAQSISEEQWKQTLIDRIEKLKNNR